MSRRVVVTGLGVVCPLGSEVAQAWDALVAGRSGVRAITSMDVSRMPAKIAGTVEDFDAEKYIPGRDLKKMDAFIHYGIAAAAQAIEDAGIVIDDSNAHRAGATIGSGVGGLARIESSLLDFEAGKKISPFLIPAIIINMISGHVSIRFGMKGPNMALVSACTTGAHSIGEAARMIARGEADIMLAGGAEMPISTLGVGGFSAARALCASRNDAPETASRPWSRDRDGFVLGEGAGVLALEEYATARARGAQIYCELAGYGVSADAFHMTQPSPGGEGAARCMQAALEDAGMNPDEVDYINAHATSTPAGDVAESDAVKMLFGAHARKLVLSSCKSMIGHLLGAAGGVEAVFSVLALKHGVVPPTINLDEPDPACDLDYVPHEARSMPLGCVVSNAFGFGGTNASLVFRPA